jgi:hypothetical protein
MGRQTGIEKYRYGVIKKTCSKNIIYKEKRLKNLLFHLPAINKAGGDRAGARNQCTSLVTPTRREGTAALLPSY